MFKHVRLASAEEVEKLRATSDYTRVSTVFAFDQNAGEPDFAVVRTVVELDPVYFSSKTNDIQKAKFVFALEERMAGAGVDRYYFNVADSNERWKQVILSWGAEKVSPSPEIRYMKVLS